MIPVLADAVTGWVWITPTTVRPTFATGPRSLMGDTMEADPGRVEARPTARHKQAFNFAIHAIVVTEPKPYQPPQITDAAGRAWLVDITGHRFTDDGRYQELDWTLRRRLADDLAPNLAAWLRTPDAQTGDRAARIVAARNDYDAAADRVRRAAAELAEAEADARATNDRLNAVLAEIAAEIQS